MKFPYTSICYLGLLFLSLMFLRCNTKSNTSGDVSQGKQKSFVLTVDRGAFHYDSFVLKGDTLRYIPKEKSNQPNILYKKVTKKILDGSVTQNLFDEMVVDGFWKLKSNYKTSGSCTSQLSVTLKTALRSKTVTCDDFERDCPELIKYIDQKVVALEGNGLVRIYLSG